jgi:aspartyl/glutamyl-tRNA(Asn/Gln) amidotransferase C subunit
LPVGEAVEPGPARSPDERALFGRWVTIEPVSEARHGGDLWQSFAHSDRGGRLWTYMAYGPFASEAVFASGWPSRRPRAIRGSTPSCHATRASGRQGRRHGGADAYHAGPPGDRDRQHLVCAPILQQTREATDALFVLMGHALDELGYRRLEWKCDSLNAPSRRAALRLGFTFEGIFRQHMIIKNRNRDTAWYAILDKEWPALRTAYQAWLNDDNFDSEGRQRKPLAAFMAHGPSAQTSAPAQARCGPAGAVISSGRIFARGFANMAVDQDTVRRIARLARIRIPEEDVAVYEAELNNILRWIEQLNALDVAGVEPLTSVVEMNLKQRDDIVTDGDCADDILANAPAAQDHYFVVPKVVE